MMRYLSFFLSVVIFWGSVTTPARAFAPLIPVAGVSLVTAAAGGGGAGSVFTVASTSGGAYALAGLAGIIGLVGGYLEIKDAQDNALRIPLGANSHNSVPTPNAPATVAPTPGNGPDNYTMCYRSNTPTGTGYSERCYLCMQNFGYQTGSYCNQYNTSTGQLTGVSYTAASTQPTCANGYTLSNGNCVLQNPRQAIDDKSCDMLVNNGQFATANDLNCSSLNDGSRLQPMIRDGKVIAYGTNSQGQPLMWTVTPGVQSYTVHSYEQIATLTETQVRQTTMTVDAPTSAVTSVQTQTRPGSISAPSGSTVPTVSNDPATGTDSPTVTQDETRPADQQTCGLPGRPACNINDDGFTGRDAFLPNKTSEITQNLDDRTAQVDNVKTSVPEISASWLPGLFPGDAVSCQPLSFDFSLSNGTLGSLSAPDVQLDICEALQLVRQILGYMLGLFTVFYVWRRFTTSNQGA